MKKKIIAFFLLFLFISLFLTGCISNSTREDILSTLTKEKYLPKDLSYEQTWAVNESPIPSIRCYHYIYEITEDNKTDVCIYRKETVHRKNKNIDFPCYPVLITTNIEVKEEMEVDSSYQCVKTEDSEQTSLYIIYKKIFCFTKWRVYTPEEYQEKFTTSE